MTTIMHAAGHWIILYGRLPAGVWLRAVHALAGGHTHCGGVRRYPAGR